MSSTFLARLMVTAVAAGQGITPLFIDLNRTHATNPLWTGHARFHIVQQAFWYLAAATAEVSLLWLISPGTRPLFYLATLFAAIPIFAFLIAMFTRRLYAGTLHDPNGVRPARIRIGGEIREIDINILLIVVAGAVLVMAVLLFQGLL
jgi:hypothetical protein